MTEIDAIQAVVFLLAVLALVKPAGAYMARVFERNETWLDPLFGRCLYPRICA